MPRIRSTYELLVRYSLMRTVPFEGFILHWNWNTLFCSFEVKTLYFLFSLRRCILIVLSEL